MKPSILFFALAVVSLVQGTPYKKNNFRDATRKLTPRRNYDKEARIVGGSEVIFPPPPLPYQVSLHFIYRGVPHHFCSGSIISEEWVLTIGSCVSYEIPENLLVVAGDVNRYTDDKSEQAVSVSEIYISDGYDDLIGLLKLASPLSFNDFVQPLPLPQRNLKASGLCNVSGGTLSIDQRSYCTNNCQIRAQLIPGTFNECGANTGAPLVCTDEEGHNYLAGVLSFLCGLPPSADVHCNWGPELNPYKWGPPEVNVYYAANIYYSVSCHIDWISAHTQL